MKLFYLSVLITPVLLLSPNPGAPGADSAREALQHIARAHKQLAEAQHGQRDKIAVVQYSAETTYTDLRLKKLTTSTAHFKLVSRAGTTFLTNGELDVYQDKQIQICIARAQRSILITQAQVGEKLAPWTKLQADLVTQSLVADNSLVKTPAGLQRRITLLPTAASLLKGHVGSIEYYLNSRTDAPTRITMYYPAQAGLHSAAIVFEGQSWKTTDAAVDQPILSHVYGPNQQLLPVYQGFKVQDLRKS